MKTVFLIGLLVLAAACTEPPRDAVEKPAALAQVATSGDNAPEGSIHNLKRRCYVMKQFDAEVYDCFGCANGKCKDEDRTVWDYIGQDVVAAQGYTCVETPDGCALA